MCVNKREIINPYTHKKLYVNCGKCPACLQERADRRTLRIRNALGAGQVCLFFTLTYRNDAIPYIKRSRLFSISKHATSYLPIFRDCDSYNRSITTVLETLSVPIDMPINVHSFHSLSNGDKNKIGVIYYPDIQNFAKKLRINLKRKYNYHETNFKLFFCAEYGGTTCRPHFHGLAFIPQTDIAVFQRAIASSWSFNDSFKNSTQIEVARNAGAYVSSYVNSSRHVPPLFRNRSLGLHSRHSYSHNFGVGTKFYEVQDVIKNYVRDRNIRRIYSSVQNGTFLISSLLLPKYVLDRHFPKFKGFARLTSNQIYDCVRNPSKLAQYSSAWLDYSKEDLHKWSTMLKNKLKKMFELGIDLYDYAYTYSNIYTTYHSELIKDQYACVVRPSQLFEMYDNIKEYYKGNIRNGLLDDSMPYCSKFETDCNKFKSNIIRTTNLSKKYDNYSKDHKIRSYIYSQLNY